MSEKGGIWKSIIEDPIFCLQLEEDGMNTAIASLREQHARKEITDEQMKKAEKGYALSVKSIAKRRAALRRKAN